MSFTGDSKLDFDVLKNIHATVSNAAKTLHKIKQFKMNQKDNQQSKGLRELMGPHKEDPFKPYQREALFPREVLQPLYEKWKREYATNGHMLAEDFYRFLLMQTK